MRLKATIIASGLVGWLGAPFPAAAQAPAPAELTVKGSATVRQKPDLAELTVSVITRGATLDGIARDHAARVARAAPVLAHLGTEGASIEQGTFSLTEESTPVSPGGRPGAEVPAYRAETRYALTVKAVDKLDAIAAEILAARLFEVGSARYAVGDEGDAIDSVRRAAMADARHQAEVYAEAGGVRLDGIRGITDGEAAGRDEAYDLPMRMAPPASVGITPPKMLEFRGSVTVTWRIAPR